jgi:predicted RNA polymerase sigma factor
MKQYLLSIYQPDAAVAYEEAIACCQNATERDFLQRSHRAMTQGR